MHEEQFKNQAAVLIAISRKNDASEHILLTKRAEHLSAHGGEVAFPGGMWESQDRSLLDTALRETHEEVGLEPSRVSIECALSHSVTRGGIVVAPYVGRIDSSAGLWPNPDELDALFWVPVDFLIADKRSRTDIFTLDGKEHWAPAYHWEGYEIWGFTARVLVELVNLRYQRNISRKNAASEILFSMPTSTGAISPDKANPSGT